MPGYDENFLKVKVALPRPSKKLRESYLRKPALRDGLYADYIHYTVVTDKERRAPVFAALNIDRPQMLKTKRTGWQVDKRIGKTFQLTNEYYKDLGGVKNPWDRGHLAMRENSAWGPNKAKAQSAAKDTFYYSNAALQHENFNEDEWLMLEQWVGNLDLALDGRISSFSGPIYGQFSRTVKPPKLDPAEVPAGFFKVVFFVNKNTRKLDVRAFVSWQDEEAIAGLGGRKVYDAQNYQTTVREIKELTGLGFIPTIAKNNPLLYTDTRTRRAKYNISHFPERIEVDGTEDILSDPKSTRVRDAMDELDVFISSALPNPKGSDQKKEWVSIINLDSKQINLARWTLEAGPAHTVKRDRKRKKLILGDVLKGNDRILKPGESVRVMPLTPLQLNNQGGTIILKDERGRQIDRVKYTKEDARPGKPVILFEYQPDRP